MMDGRQFWSQKRSCAMAGRAEERHATPFAEMEKTDRDALNWPFGKSFEMNPCQMFCKIFSVSVGLLDSAFAENGDRAKTLSAV